MMELERRNCGSSNEIYTSESRSLKLEFSKGISSPTLTGKKIKGEGAAPIEVALVDSLSRQKFISGPEASAGVEIVVLQEDFGEDDWTHEEFHKNIVRDWKGKNLLQGNVYLNLEEGTGSLGEIYFKHDKKWMSKCKFRLGARLVKFFNQVRVKEAKTEPFELKDSRNELYKKHHPPSPTDNVWRLENIGRSGPLYKRLEIANIITVKDFLDLLFSNRQRLQEIYGSDGKKWKMTVSHAQTCTDKMVCYSSSYEQKPGVVFNVSGEVLGLTSRCNIVPFNNLSDIQKDDAYRSVASVFKRWDNVFPFDEVHEEKHIANPLDSAGLETPSGRLSVHAQSSTSSEGFFSFNITGRTNNVESYTSNASVPGQDSNTPTDDRALSVQDYGVSAVYFKVENHGFESHHSNQNVIYESTSVGDQAGRIDGAHRRWTRLSRVWFFIKWMGAADIRVHKKRRLC